ncbi:hypothetical protein [Actinoplanes sp. L3-i22]|uniref:hypothetical protein n=1 Tax=Actinoplanes sp. L3-i22 TaxID=2836373 RepID=UPI001C786E29|nr:hypothetical protein [Actinoplanes sp. L3-i22]BCY15371.1 hypothetical protein L3i22_104590 [Actinoplanes sp. L3-i22]
MTESDQSKAPPAEKPAEPAAAEPAAAAAPAAETPPAAPEATGPSKTTDIVPGPGGVMTDEVGVVTGDLTLRTELVGTDLTLRVQYKDAEEWYVVTGGKAKLADPADLDAVHNIAVGILNRPEG